MQSPLEPETLSAHCIERLVSTSNTCLSSRSSGEFGLGLDAMTFSICRCIGGINRFGRVSDAARALTPVAVEPHRTAKIQCCNPGICFSLEFRIHLPL